MYRLSWNLGASTSWNPQGLSRPVMGLLYLHIKTTVHVWAYLTQYFVKVKQSRNRPSVAQRVPGGLGCQIFMTFGTWRWWGCQPHAPAAFTPRKCSWCSFSLGAESTPGPWCARKEICHWKIQWHHRESIPGPYSVLCRIRNVVGKPKRIILCSITYFFFPRIVPFIRYCIKMLHSRTGQRRQK